MSEPVIALELSRAEAIVLFEFLYRFSESDNLEILDRSEKRVLWNLKAEIENQIPEPFYQNYLDVLEEARSSLRDEES